MRGDVGVPLSRFRIYATAVRVLKVFGRAKVDRSGYLARLHARSSEVVNRNATGP